MNMLSKLTIEAFLDELASSSPAPGGGGAAALVTGVSAALNAMVYNLTTGKKVYDELSDENKRSLDENLKICEEVYVKALEYMEQDRVVFLELITSYKMSKDTEEKNKLREEAIKLASDKCLNTPLELAKMSLGFYDNIRFAMTYGNKNLISDAGVSAIMLHGAIESSLLNVAINLSSIEDEKYKLRIKCEIDQIKTKSLKNKEEISKYIYEYIEK